MSNVIIFQQLLSILDKNFEVLSDVRKGRNRPYRVRDAALAASFAYQPVH